MEVPSLPPEFQTLEKHFEDVEAVAEEILSDRQEIISLDKRRNTNREALRQLKINPSCRSSSQIWTCVGNMIMRMPKSNVISSIEKEENKLESEIKNIRNGLNLKIDKLNKIEGKQPTRGSGLKALSKEEWDGMKQVLGS